MEFFHLLHHTSRCHECNKLCSVIQRLQVDHTMQHPASEIAAGLGSHASQTVSGMARRSGLEFQLSCFS